MKQTTFKVPLYDFTVTLATAEGADDMASVKSLMKKCRCTQEHIDEMMDMLKRGCYDGADTYYNFSIKRILVIFLSPSTSKKHRREIFEHEKRHVEDRILQHCAVDDIEAAGYLAGFLGGKFYEFEVLTL